MSFNPIREAHYEATNYTTKLCETCGFAHGNHECLNPDLAWDTDNMI